MSKGIDYGMGQTNIDRDNGIRYGVIPANALLDPWDSFEADYGEPTCPKCGGNVEDTDANGAKDYYCENCECNFYSEEVYGDEPNGYYLDSPELKVTVGSYGDCFVIKSEFFTRAQFCSPCAPGACHLETPCDDGERCYCFGHDWFEGEKAPYPVYRVDTGEMVEPEAK